MSAGRVERFAATQIAGVLAIGTVGVLIAGLQPQLLGAMAVEGRLSAGALGDVATAELLAMGVAAGAAGAALPATRLRRIAAVTLFVLAALDLVTGRATGHTILFVRALAGLAEGVLVWLAIGMIVRTARPARWAGLYLMVQTGAQFALSVALGVWVMPGGGSGGGFAALGVVSLIALATLPWLPARFDALDVPAGAGAMRLPARGWLALASIALWLAFVVAVWVYAEPLGLQHGLSHRQVGTVAPLSLAMQMIGAGAAALLAGRLRVVPVLVACAAADGVLLAAMGAPPSPAIFVAATAVFGFLWLFAMPFQLPVVIAADPSRRAAELAGGAQLVGASLGPFVAAKLVSDADVDGVLWFGAAALAGALLLIAAALARRSAWSVR